MTLLINGEEKHIEDNKTLLQIIIDLDIENKVMASAVNMEIVKKEDWNSYIPKDNDKLELLQFVGGG
ncbi:MAG: sulfur carrier protein ThiS [Campylobacterota bacterium]|nr:sulfur carrier protein ThiS [Campylobacterota bacterium]